MFHRILLLFFFILLLFFGSKGNKKHAEKAFLALFILSYNKKTLPLNHDFLFFRHRKHPLGGNTHCKSNQRHIGGHSKRHVRRRIRQRPLFRPQSQRAHRVLLPHTRLAAAWHCPTILKTSKAVHQWKPFLLRSHHLRRQCRENNGYFLQGTSPQKPSSRRLL